MTAYDECFSHTSSTWAPWYILPADQKPYCRLLVAFLIYQSSVKMKLEYPHVNKERSAELLNIRKLPEQE